MIAMMMMMMMKGTMDITCSEILLGQAATAYTPYLECFYFIIHKSRNTGPMMMMIRMMRRRMAMTEMFSYFYGYWLQSPRLGGFSTLSINRDILEICCSTTTTNTSKRMKCTFLCKIYKLILNDALLFIASCTFKVFISICFESYS